MCRRNGWGIMIGLTLMAHAIGAEDHSSPVEAAHEQARQLLLTQPDGDAALSHLWMAADTLVDDAAAQAAVLGRLLDHAQNHPQQAPWTIRAGQRLLALSSAEPATVAPSTLSQTRSRLWSAYIHERRWLDAWLLIQQESQAVTTLGRAELLLEMGVIERVQALLEQVSQIQGADEELRRRIERLTARMKQMYSELPAKPIVARNAQFASTVSALLSEATPPTVWDLRRLYDTPVHKMGLVELADDYAVGGWCVLEQLVRSHEGLTATLRASPRPPAGQIESEATDWLVSSLAAFRYAPWSDQAQAALLTAAETLLRRGQTDLARRCLADVLLWSEVEAIRGQTQTLQDMTSSREAEASRQIPVPLAPDLASPLWLQRPAMPTWSLGFFHSIPPEVLATFTGLDDRLSTADGRIFLTGPELLVCYQPGQAEPLWVRTVPRPSAQLAWMENHPRRMQNAVVPGPMRPAAEDGRVWTRWGLDLSQGHPVGLLSLHAGNGLVRWSSEANRQWSGTWPMPEPVTEHLIEQRDRRARTLWPISDPVVAEGRLYVLAYRHGERGVDADAMTWRPLTELVCLDADTGQVYWAQPLASQVSGTGQRLEWFTEEGRYQAHLTVHEGQVYCSTNLGFVASVDARDGMVHWVRQYPAATQPNRGSIAAWYAREGAAPQVVGGHVIFMPPKAAGVFALDRASGQALWDHPFIPADRLVGRWEDRLILEDAHRLLALNGHTGQVLWDRPFDAFTRAGHVKASLDGPWVVALADDRLMTVDVRSGEVVAEHADTAYESVTALAAHAGHVALLSHEPRTLMPVADLAGHDSLATNGHQETAAVTGWRPVWVHGASRPSIWQPPSGTDLDDWRFVASPGWLGALSPEAGAPMRWQRLIRPGLSKPVWAAGTLVLLYPDEAIAIDAISGRLRWKKSLQWTATGAHATQDVLIVRHDRPGEAAGRLTGIDLHHGELLWRRQLDMSMKAFRIEHASGVETLWVAGPDGGGHRLAQLDPRDGRVLSSQLVWPRANSALLATLLTDDAFFGFDATGHLHRITLADHEHVRYDEPVHLNEWRNPPPRVRLERVGDWIRVEQRPREHHNYLRRRQAIYHREDNTYILRRPHSGWIRGDRLFERTNAALTLVDLPTQAIIGKYEVSESPYPARQVDVIEAWEEADTVSVVTMPTSLHQGGVPGALQIDRFDRNRGVVLTRHAVETVRLWHHAPTHDNQHTLDYASQASWARGRLLVTGLHAAHLLTPPAAGQPSTNDRQFTWPVIEVLRSSAPIVLGGLTDQWRRQNLQALPVGDGASLWLAHDRERLYVAMQLPKTEGGPHIGRGMFGGGDWLELALATDRHAWHLAVAVNEHGQTVWADLSHPRTLIRHFLANRRSVWDTDLHGGGIPADAQAVVRHDPQVGTLTYELILPLEGAGRSELSMSLAAWRDVPGIDERARLVAWGGALIGREAGTPGQRRLRLVDAP